jgi:tetratricopeptide (TPR) repeat protein
MSNATTLAERLEQADNSAAQSWIITELLLNAYPATIRQSVIAAAVPHWFTAEILAALLDLSMGEAEERYVALQQLSIVQPFGDLGHTLHDLTRNGILNYFAGNAIEELYKYSQCLQTYFSHQNLQNSQTEVESLYHELILNVSHGRAILKIRARSYRRTNNFTAVENLLRNYRELINLGLLEPVDQVELERQEYWTTEALAIQGKQEKDEQGIIYLRKAMERWTPSEQYQMLLSDEPERWREHVDTYKRDYVLSQIESASNVGNIVRQSLWLAELGDIYRSEGNFEAALQQMDAALLITPKDARIWAYRGQIKRQMKQYEEALADFERAINLDNMDVWIIANRGLTYRLMGAYEEALTNFSQAIALDGKDAWAIASRGQVHKFLRHYKEALTDFDRAIALDETMAWAIAVRGETYRIMARYEEALADFARAITLDEKYAWAIARRGETYRIMARYEEALTDLTRAITLDEKYAWAIASRGQVYQSLRQYEEALTNLNHAISLDEKYVWAIGFRGYVYLLLRRYGEAQTDLTRALFIKENDWDFYSRSLSYIAQNNIEIARTDLTRAIELANLDYAQDPHDWRNTLNLMLYHLVAGDNSTAERFLQEAFDGNAPVHRLKGAIQDLEELLTVLPDHAQARTFLQRIEAHVADLG